MTTSGPDPHALLRSLGRTPGAVAASLLALGCRGRLGHARECPLAVYLCRNGWPQAEVYGRHAWAPALSLLPLPGPVAYFAADFDRGVYPDLVAPP